MKLTTAGSLSTLLAVANASPFPLAADDGSLHSARSATTSVGALEDAIGSLHINCAAENTAYTWKSDVQTLTDELRGAGADCQREGGGRGDDGCTTVGRANSATVKICSDEPVHVSCADLAGHVEGVVGKCSRQALDWGRPESPGPFGSVSGVVYLDDAMVDYVAVTQDCGDGSSGVVCPPLPEIAPPVVG